MLPRLQTSAGHETTIHWDGKDLLSRLKLVLNNRDLFCKWGLVTEAEFAMLENMSESAIEYVLEREEQPFFTSIHLKKDVETQHHREKLLTALRAVFL